MDGAIAQMQRALLELTRQVEQQDGEGKLVAQHIENLQKEAEAARRQSLEDGENAARLQSQLEEQDQLLREKRGMLLDCQAEAAARHPAWRRWLRR